MTFSYHWSSLDLGPKLLYFIQFRIIKSRSPSRKKTRHDTTIARDPMRWTAVVKPVGTPALLQTSKQN